MLKQVSRWTAVSMLVLLMTVLFAAPALAFDARTGNNITIPSDEVVQGDLYVAATTIIIDGVVNGDVFAAGETIRISGTVNGGVTVVGRTVALNGDIAHGARVAAQEIDFTGSVGRDLLAAGSTLNIDGQGVISGDLVLAAGDATVNGRVDGNVLGSARTATLSDGVGGSVNLNVQTLTVASTADIRGNLEYTSENEANIQSGAVIGGQITREQPPVQPPQNYLPALVGLAAVWQAWAFVVTFIVGLIIIVLLPRFVTRMTEGIQVHPWPSLGWGALILVATPIASVVVMATVIGLSAGLITLVLYGIAVYLSQVPVSLLIGRLIIRQNRPLESTGLMIGAFALGLFILSVVRLIPFLGWLIGLLIVVFGLGALVTMHARREGAL